MAVVICFFRFKDPYTSNVEVTTLCLVFVHAQSTTIHVTSFHLTSLRIPLSILCPNDKISLESSCRRDLPMVHSFGIFPHVLIESIKIPISSKSISNYISFETTYVSTLSLFRDVLTFLEPYLYTNLNFPITSLIIPAPPLSRLHFLSPSLHRP